MHDKRVSQTDFGRPFQNFHVVKQERFNDYVVISDVKGNN